MTPSQIIDFLRKSVAIEDPDSENDSSYTSMSYEELELFVEVVITRDFPGVSFDDLPTEYIYPVILLSKKELYYALAVKEAPLYDLGADNNNYLKRSQRFDHYMKLILQVDKEYKDYQENGGAGSNTLTSFDVLLPNRSATRRNYEKGVIPAPVLSIGSETCTSVELSWKVSMSHFESYVVYISRSPILDKFSIGNKISSEAKEVVRIHDYRQTCCRIEGLTPDTTYHVLLAAREMSHLTGYAEAVFSTTENASVDLGGCL